MSVNRMFRTCPSSGLVFHEPAEKLMRWNAGAAGVALLIGGLLAIGVVLPRWQVVHLLPPDLFYQFLTAHGLNMLVFWIIFFEIAILYFASSTLLRCRLPAPGGSGVCFPSRARMGAPPTFYAGLILFAVGALIGCFVFFGTLVVAKAEKTYHGSGPLLTLGGVPAALHAVF